MRVHYVAAYMAEFPSDRANTIHVMRMCEAFAAIGHDVVLYVRDTNNDVDSIFQFYGLTRTFNIVPLRSEVPKLNRLIFAALAARRARADGADLLVSRTAVASFLGARLSIPVVFDAHGPIWERNFAERVAYRLLKNHPKLACMTANSGALKGMYEGRRLAPAKGIVLAPNGAAADEVNPAVQLGGRCGVLKVGYTGHLYAGRGVEVIVACAAALPECDFHLVGGAGKELEEWKVRAARPNIHFHGFVKPSLVSSYRAKCDILLAPYQATGVTVSGGGGDTSAYMNPIKVMEYISSARAIVASDLPAIREVLPDSAAMFAAPDRVDEWINCIVLLKDPRRRLELAEACSSAAMAMTWERRASVMLP